MKEFMLYIGAIITGMLVMISVMIKGWGLEPKSWFWIIVVYFLGNILSAMFLVAASRKIE